MGRSNKDVFKKKKKKGIITLRYGRGRLAISREQFAVLWTIGNESSVSLAGAATSIIFVARKRVVATKVLYSCLLLIVWYMCMYICLYCSCLSRVLKN